MKCPQCGTEFDAPIEQCFICGWDFSQTPGDFTPRTSKLAVFAMMLGILCLFTLYLPFLLAVILGVIALRKIRESRGRLAGERIAIAAILVPVLSFPIFLALGYAVWSRDAGPVPNEFTEADFVQVRPENEASWELLLQLDDEGDNPNGAPAIGLTREDVDQLNMLFENEPNTIEERFEFIRAHKNTIEDLWEKSSKGRAVFEQLAQFDEIAVFTPPKMDEFQVFSVDAKYLMRIYTAKSLLLLQEGKDVEAVKLLIFFDSTMRKYCISARSLISKLVGYAVVSSDIQTAVYLAGSADISKEAMSLLVAHFESINPQKISLKNCIIHEYLTYKNSLYEIKQETRKTRMLKFNSSCRYCYSHCRRIIQLDEDMPPYQYCPISVWPWEEPNWPKVSLEAEEISPFNIYTLYNPIGSMLTQILFPAHEKIFQIKEKVLIRDDLFQWVLARRLGQEGSLTARAYSDEYTVDVEKGLVFSVGPDGEAYTEDDIKLRIDPAVLGLE